MLTRMRLLALVLAAWPWGALADTPPARVTNSLTYDAASNAITSTVDGAKRGLDCHVSNALGTPGNVGVVVGGAVIDPRATRALTTSDQVSCAQLGTWSIAGTVSLPTNAAQETGGNLASAASSLASLNGKTTGFDLDSGAGTQTVQGVSLRLTASGGSVEAATATNPLRTDPTGTTTQPVSAATLPLPAGAASAALQTSGNATLTSIDGKITNTSGGAIKTDGSAFTQPISAVSLPLPTGATTASAQSAGNASLSSIDSKLGTLGQKNSAGSAPVVFASDQSALPVNQNNAPWTVTGTGTAGTAATGVLTVQGIASMTPLLVNGSGFTQPISAASLPLPTGASTAGNQTTANASLSSIDGKLGSLGQKLMAGSAPVVIASDQSAIPITGTITATNAANGATGSAVPAQATFVGGRDGSGNLRGLAVSTGGVLSTDGSGTTQPISAASLPLPSGASTSALQTAGNASLSSIDTKTATLVSGRVPVDGSAVTQPISAVALPLPAGAATEASLAKLPIAQGAATGANSGTLVQGVATTAAPTYTTATINPLSMTLAGLLRVDGSGTTQPISAAALPLPSGAATSALQTAGNASLSSIDTKTATLVSGRVPVDGSAVTQPISAAALPLPSGASTAAKQPALGTAGTASADVLTVQGIASMTPLLVNGSGTTQPVTGTGSAGTAATGVVTVQGIASMTPLLTNGSGFTQPISAASLPLPAGAATEASLAKLTIAQGAATGANTGALVQGVVTTAAPTYTTATINPLSMTTAGALRTDASATTQPISAASLPLPSGAATSAAQTTGNNSLASIDGKTATLVSGRVPVDGSAVTQPISAAALPLPAGASTSALQTTGNSSLSSIDGKTATLVSGRVPVDGSAVTQPISAAALPLPSGASTSANQTTQNASLSSIDGKIPVQGQTTQALSHPTIQPGDLTSSTGSITVQDTGSSVGTQGNNQTIVTGTPTAGSTFAIATNAYNSGIAKVSGTWTGSVQVEASSDGGTSWIPLPSHQVGGSIFFLAYTSNVQVAFNLGSKTNVRVRAPSAITGTISVQFVLSYNPSGITFVNNAVRITDGANSSVATPLTVLAASTAATGSNTSAVVALSPNSPVPAGTNTIGSVIEADGTTATYEAGFSGLAMAATATDVFTITGSASKTIKVRKLNFSCTQTTGAYQNVVLLKRSTANTGGTSTTLTNVPLDSANAAATGTVQTYTANPTLGTLVGNLRVEKVPMGTNTIQVGGGATPPGTNQGAFQWSYETRGQPLILRGTAQVLSVNLAATTVTGSNCDGWIQWTEE